MGGIDNYISQKAIPGLIWAYRFAADGTAERIPDDESRDAVSHPEGWIWLHLNLSDARARDWIAASDDLPKGARDLLLSNDTHLRLDVIDSTVAGVFTDIRREFDKDSDEVGYLRFALNERLVISARRNALHSVEEARLAIDEGHKLGSAVALIESIVDKFADAAAGICEKLIDQVDLIEDRVVDERAGDQRRPLAQLRRTAVRLHRQLVGLHAIFNRLERLAKERLPQPLVEMAHRLATRLDTLHHDVHVIQERARLLQDEVSARAAAEANRLLYIISILTAVLVPPTLVTGVFGMNTKGLPFSEDPNGFLYAMALCASSALGVYLLMRSLQRRD